MAGSPCPVEVMKRCIEEMHMAEVSIAYGMTETSPVSCQTRSDDDLERLAAAKAWECVRRLLEGDHAAPAVHQPQIEMIGAHPAQPVFQENFAGAEWAAVTDQFFATIIAPLVYAAWNAFSPTHVAIFAEAVCNVPPSAAAGAFIAK